MFINEIFENDDDLFAPSWRLTVIQLLRKMLESPVRLSLIHISEPTRQIH
jgi:hypothetical protein